MSVNTLSTTRSRSTLHGSEDGEPVRVEVHVLDTENQDGNAVPLIPFTATTVDDIDTTLNYSISGEQLTQ